MRQRGKYVLVAVVVLLALAQFVRPAKTNPPEDPKATLESQSQPPPEIAAMLERSCQDCHSHRTRWPWYASVAPVSWLVIDDVKEARSHLNFSQWQGVPAEERRKLFGEMCDEVKDGGMPLASYTWIHSGTKLSEAQRRAFCSWSDAERKKVAAESAAPGTAAPAEEKKPESVPANHKD